MLIQYYNNISDNITNDKVNLVYTIWYVRKIVLLISILSLLYTYCSHKDEYLENYKLLQRIENRLDSLQNIAPISEITAIRKFLFVLHHKYLSIF
jgi:hypothetical protein